MVANLSNGPTGTGIVKERSELLELGVYRTSLPLTEPYRLPFGDLTSFETLFVRLDGGGRTGFGEVTPLPGYSEETVDSAVDALTRAVAALADGETVDQVIAEVFARAPFAASGLACAMETWREGVAAAFEAPIDAPIPLAALCPGKDPRKAAQAARGLVGEGYRVLKLKVAGASGTVAEDLARVRAVAAVVPEDCRLRLDANQCLGVSEANELVGGLVGLPISLLEQPFPPERWQATADLAAAGPVPVMLDESICTANDIDRAAETGVRFVKLKLCKHAGMAATGALISQAKSRGLGVVFGNGVQGALGNHLEARLFAEKTLEMAGEMNGFLKVSRSPIECRNVIAGGQLHAGGLVNIASFLAEEEPLHAVSFSTRQI